MRQNKHKRAIVSKVNPLIFINFSSNESKTFSLIPFLINRTEFEIKESVGNETVDSSFENQENEQKLHFTTVQPTETPSK